MILALIADGAHAANVAKVDPEHERKERRVERDHGDPEQEKVRREGRGRARVD